jgi:glycosyltransferase involved in cell wall biosynthesis
MQRVVPRSLRRATHVLVDSYASRDDLVRLLGVDAGRITVLYPGVDARFRPLPARHTAPVRARLGLPERFLLFVGTLEPRKNLVRLLEACAALPDPLPLVIGGRRGWLYEDIFHAVARYGLDTRVHFLDFVADTDLPALYNLASAFVYPSLYEGFGLPAAEALACGTPVVTSDVASLPEVVGNAAILVNPLDSQAIAGGIMAALAQRAPLQQAGPVQAQQFSWHQSAARLLDCYRASQQELCHP